MPKDDDRNPSKNLMMKTEEKPRFDLTFKEHIYIKIMSYEPCYDQSFKVFLLKNLHYRGEILQILQQLGRLM
jgi:hypothetical protein